MFRNGDLFRTFKTVGSGVIAPSTMIAERVNRQQSRHVFCMTRDGKAFGSSGHGAALNKYPLP